ncbi:hypothetical protein [Nocardioides ultimimeridianus]
MVAIVVLLAAAVLLVVGWVTDSDAQLIAACVLAGLVAVALIADHLLRRDSAGLAAGTTVASEARAQPDPAAEDPAVDDDAWVGPGTAQELPVAAAGEVGESETGDAQGVVFVPGRMTFHRPGCRTVEGKSVGRGSRADLEGAGMNACRSCFTA